MNPLEDCSDSYNVKYIIRNLSVIEDFDYAIKLCFAHIY